MTRHVQRNAQRVLETIPSVVKLAKLVTLASFLLDVGNLREELVGRRAVERLPHEEEVDEGEEGHTAEDCRAVVCKDRRRQQNSSARLREELYALMSIGFGLGVSGKSHMTVVRRQNKIVTTFETPPSHPRRIHLSRFISLFRRRS